MSVSHTSSGNDTFGVEVGRTWSARTAQLAASALHATPFQHRLWFDVWYRTLGSRSDVSPLVVSIERRATGKIVALLPLVVRTSGARRSIEFADLGITDYNAPLLFPDAPATPAESEAMLGALLDALAGTADILVLNKMPARIGDVPNPLTLARGAVPGLLSGNVVRIDGSWEDYHRGLDGKVRREFDRCWRVFVRDGVDARFVRARTREEAHHILSRIETLQRERICALGLPYALDGECYSKFYHDLIDAGLEQGYTIVTALLSGQTDVVGAVFGISDGRRYAMMRLGQAGEAWSHCSPGRLAFQRTMRALKQDGHTHFDFTVGNYPYKTVFQVERTSLFELVRPLSWRGAVVHNLLQAGKHTKRRLETVPVLASPVRRLAGMLRRRLDAEPAPLTERQTAPRDPAPSEAGPEGKPLPSVASLRPDRG